MSTKYIPCENPGGINFHVDKNFAEAYQCYQIRIQNLKNIDRQNHLDKSIVYHDEKMHQESLIYDDIMMNKDGINIAKLKGAIFLDQETHSKCMIIHEEIYDQKTDEP
ncbi:hypothetical protein [Wolbachia endosymbiont of Howardula sp.]|uniref:hypothetical protein n=1 Tax=Wolbachia endosymbiont of Howardula sp. TaxID=2916816 RepID=UPI00217D369E|nr:hypothetical protein [Wolbachia endosymbiont of Howardula sp.]UWI83105.1 hypothetical protein MC061_02255 [Wolbachia endosymbiont of Howardula sp.]